MLFKMGKTAKKGWLQVERCQKSQNKIHHMDSWECGALWTWECLMKMKLKMQFNFIQLGLYLYSTFYNIIV